MWKEVGNEMRNFTMEKAQAMRKRHDIALQQARFHKKTLSTLRQRWHMPVQRSGVLCP